MLIVLAVIGLGLIVLVLLDAFETVVLPRRIVRPLRLSRLFYWPVQRLWAAIGRRLRNPENFLAFFGPLSLIMLLAFWAGDMEGGIGHYLYFSGTAFFTLGDVAPVVPLDQIVTVAEGATGFSFLAVIIGYLPVFYTAFSQRERQITLLDARAGSPPSAVEFFRRHCRNGQPAHLETFFNEWEHWAAELLESHLSYPMLGLFRSQHENESWLAALTMVLDVSALVIATFDESFAHTANLTFAIARHAAVDLSQVYNTPPKALVSDRLLSIAMVQMQEILGPNARVSEEKLSALRALYEPYVKALSDTLLMPLPTWTVKVSVPDNWQTTAWTELDGVIMK